MKLITRLLVIVTVLLLSYAPARGLITADMTELGVDAASLADALMPAGVLTLNAATNTADSPSLLNAIGAFAEGLADGLPLDSGLMMSTGTLTNGAITPNTDDGINFAHGTPGDADLDILLAPDASSDAAVLEFDFRAGTAGNAVTFQFVFASDEYLLSGPNAVENDIFGLFVDNVNIALVPGPTPGSTVPVSTFNVNETANSVLFTNNEPFFFAPNPTPFAIQYDGFTKMLTAKVRFDRTIDHHVKIAVADAIDSSIDSAVFIAPAVVTKISNIGTFRNALWSLDMSGNGAWSGPAVDRSFSFGLTTDIPVTGDWTGDGVIKIGVFRSGKWFLDMNGNGRWEGPSVDRTCSFGLPTDIPVTGDWNNTGASKIGVYRAGTWVLDLNGNCTWDGPVADRSFSFGLPGDKPVTGKWTSIGGTKIGVFRNGLWALDFNGNGAWDGPAADRSFSFGLAADKPVTGDWSGDGITKIGTFRNGSWALDLNGNGVWNGAAVDTQIPAFGLSTDTPVAGVW